MHHTYHYWSYMITAHNIMSLVGKLMAYVKCNYSFLQDFEYNKTPVAVTGRKKHSDSTWHKFT